MFCLLSVCLGAMVWTVSRVQIYEKLHELGIVVGFFCLRGGFLGGELCVGLEFFVGDGCVGWWL